MENNPVKTYSAFVISPPLKSLGQIVMLKSEITEITDPNGVIWRVGDKVLSHKVDGYSEPVEAEIEVIHPGNGSWARYQPNGDAGAVWFGLSNGIWSRPWLLERVPCGKKS